MMGLFTKGRPRSQSTGSVTPRPLSQDADHNALFLPTNDHVYLTHTKDGKPALGRKKTTKLLQDFGFDIIGQSFGIPSRRDYEGRTRRLSAASQSSGLITAQATPRRSQRQYADDDSEPPTAGFKTSSLNSSSTTLPIAVTRYDDQGIPGPRQHPAYNANPSFPKPQAFGQHHIPPPPPPPSVVGWCQHPFAQTSTAPVPVNYYSTAYQPTHMPSYSYNSTPMYQGNPNWVNPQHHVATQRPDHPIIPVPSAAAIPTLPHHQQIKQTQFAHIPNMQAVPAVCTTNIPPPPPPPPEWLQAGAMATGRKGMPRQDTRQVSNNKKPAKKVGQDAMPSRDVRQENDKHKHNEDVRRRLSKRIRHVHVCSGCGKKRSTRYQKAHPLRRGEVPALNYCYTCLRDAADTDCDTSDGHSVSHSSYGKSHRETSVVWPSSDEGRTIADGQYSYEQSRHGPRWIKKSSRFGPFSRLFSRKVASDSFPSSPLSASSAEESISRASSPVSDSYAAHSVQGSPRPSARRRRRRAKSGIVQQAKRISPRQPRCDSEGSWSTDYESTLILGQKKSSKVERDTNVETEQTFARRRIPRPRPHSKLSDTEPFPSAHADEEYVARRLENSLGLDTKGATTVSAKWPSDGVKEISDHSENINSTEARSTMKQTGTRGTAKEGVKKRHLPSSVTGNHTDGSSNPIGFGAQTPMDTSSRTPAPARLRSKLRQTTEKSTRHPGSNLPSTERQVPLDHGPHITPEQTEAFYQFPSSDKSRRQRAYDHRLDVDDEPKPTSNWGEPLTPTDVPYVGDSHSPCVKSDSWSDYQTDMEREVEEMAERDLAYAGKLFDSLSGSLGGSATSAFPEPSFVTTSNMSIVSLNSDSDHSDVDIATPSVIEVEEKKEAEADVKPTKRIEFSSELEQQQELGKLSSPTDLTIVHAKHANIRTTELATRPNNNLYDESEIGQDEDDVDCYFTSPVGSSLIGHTGHSADELVLSTPTRTATGHRLRSFMRLLSA
ncbi:hypothetical protein F4678DRAFT_144805 [Xylaria arbuscula]|nr:hypothetical protein F4678DRAFT_144805 [Xylaria arbuscula]